MFDLLPEVLPEVPSALPTGWGPDRVTSGSPVLSHTATIRPFVASASRRPPSANGAPEKNTTWSVSELPFGLVHFDHTGACRQFRTFKGFRFQHQAPLGQPLGALFPAEVHRLAQEYFRLAQVTHDIQNFQIDQENNKQVQTRTICFLPQADQTVLGLFWDLHPRSWASPLDAGPDQALIEAIPDSILRVNRQGTYLYVRESTYFTPVVDTSQLVGKHLADTLPPDVAAPVLAALERAFVTHEVQSFVCQAQLKGDTVLREGLIRAVDEDEAVITVRDVTERHKQLQVIETHLEKTQELGEIKSRFMEMVSHEMRTPIAAIQASTQFLENFDPTLCPEKRRRHLNRIQDHVRMMTQLLNDASWLNESVPADTPVEPCNLTEVLEDIVHTFNQNPAQVHMAQLHLPLTPLHVVAAPQYLGLIFDKLLTNAVQFAPGSDLIQVQVSVEDDQAVMRIADAGSGIYEEDQPHIFEAFYRGGNAEHIRGTGLGLTIARRVLAVYNGTIALEKTGTAGTTFRLTLPLIASV